MTKKKPTYAGHGDDALTRFRSLVSGLENGCLVWLGYKNALGYGVFHFSGKRQFAYRYSYELVNGFVARGLVLDHLCRNPSCVNPAHLEAVSHRENIRRGVRFWERCPHGDAYRNPRNRTCQACANDKRRNLYRELRGIGIPATEASRLSNAAKQAKERMGL